MYINKIDTHICTVRIEKYTVKSFYMYMYVCTWMNETAITNYFFFVFSLQFLKLYFNLLQNQKEYKNKNVKKKKETTKTKRSLFLI